MRGCSSGSGDTDSEPDGSANVTVIGANWALAHQTLGESDQQMLLAEVTRLHERASYLAPDIRHLQEVRAALAGAPIRRRRRHMQPTEVPEGADRSDLAGGSAEVGDREAQLFFDLITDDLDVHLRDRATPAITLNAGDRRERGGGGHGREARPRDLCPFAVTQHGGNLTHPPDRVAGSPAPP
jgi:hypothetical protein